jgi:hypothetical protein
MGLLSYAFNKYRKSVTDEAKKEGTLGKVTPNRFANFVKKNNKSIKKGLHLADIIQGPPMKEGGIVKKTMPHLLHKGELVIPAHLVKHFHNLK